MLFRPTRIALVVAAAVMVSGCTTVAHQAKKSPLEPARMPPDCFVVEIYFVRFPAGDPVANELLWNEVDEQHFPPLLRQKLLQNGFRVGLAGSPIPQALADLMQLDDQAAPAGEAVATKIEAFGSTPQVVCRHLQARAGHRNEIVASGLYDELPVLVCESGNLWGRSYSNAQGIFALTAVPEPDGRVRLTLVPEIHYGEPRQRWVGSDGVLRMEAGRSRRVFDDLAVSATVSPGCMLLLSSLPNRSGSVGHSFLTHVEAGKPEQKLLVIRLVQTQHDGLFDPAEPLPLDRMPSANP